MLPCHTALQHSRQPRDSLPPDLSTLLSSHTDSSPSTPFTSPPHPSNSWLVLDLVTPTLGVRGQERNQAPRPGGTGLLTGIGILDAIRSRVHTEAACAPS